MKINLAHVCTTYKLYNYSNLNLTNLIVLRELTRKHLTTFVKWW